MHERSTRFLLDTNVFIAAIRRGWTRSTDLVIRLVDGPETLIGNEALIGEYRKYANEFGGFGQILFYHLQQKVEVLELLDDDIARCQPFFPEGQEADVLHAATCVGAGGILISNDKHFERIHKAGIVEVWTISEAIKRII